MASFLDARAHHGRWLLRIEDIDKPREIAGSADRILSTLRAFGMEWDGEAVRQSDRIDFYAAALRSLESRNLTFECSCSRLQLEDESRYPGTCRMHPAVSGAPTAIRLRVEPSLIYFSDRIQGAYRQDVAAAVVEFMLNRMDQLYAYGLSGGVDDAAQGVTHIVRGADLLDNTPRQIYLQRELGLPLPRYAHVPVLTEPDNTKLAKSRRSVPMDSVRALPQLLAVFSMLGLPVPASLAHATLAEAWDWAIAHWNVNNAPKRLNVRVTP